MAQISKYSSPLLALYWTLCVLATHVQVPSAAEPLMIADKAIHATMYAILAMLLGIRLGRGGRAPAVVFGLGLFILAVYGAADEMTQPAFGRTCDLFDWFADLVGAGLGLGAYWVWPSTKWGRPS